jgi:hypothetical protein
MEMIEMENKSKVIQKSPFGFKIEGHNDVWIKCDKKLILNDKFKNLKVNDVIYDLLENPKGFLINFAVLNSRRDTEGGVIKSSPKDNSCDSPSSLNIVRGSSLERGNVLNPQQSKTDSFNSNSVQDNIRYGQSVNIALEITRKTKYSSDIQEIEDIFDVADKVYIEFNKRVGGN